LFSIKTYFDELPKSDAQPYGSMFYVLLLYVYHQG